MDAAAATTTPPICADCRPAETAAYLDSELSAEAAARFEQHAHTCAACAATLNEQRRLLCLLDVAFGDMQHQPGLPRDFSRVVQARAQSDMGRLRQRGERKRALLLCAGLTALAFALLGARAFGEAFAPVRVVARALGAALDMFGHMLVETGQGTLLILRALGAQLAREPGAHRLLLFTGLTGVIVLLLRLISSYHRTRIPD